MNMIIKLNIGSKLAHSTFVFYNGKIKITLIRRYFASVYRRWPFARSFQDVWTGHFKLFGQKRFSESFTKEKFVTAVNLMHT